MISAPPVQAKTGFRLQGELRLRFEKCPQRHETVLRERYRRGLFHFGKPYRESQRLVLQVLNPTAGLFAHDRMTARIEVGEGASAAVLAPSSTQIYAMPEGGFAESSFDLTVGSGATACYLPRWSVLHAGSRFRQATRIEVARSANLLFLEPLSLGRAAHGERLLFDWFESSLEIRREGRLVVREAWKVGRELRRWAWQFRGQQASGLATLYLILPDGFPRFEECEAALRLNPPPNTLCSLTALDEGVYSVRLLSASNLSLGKILGQLQSFLPASVVFPQTSQRIL
jgi:urease accessory protein